MRGANIFILLACFLLAACGGGAAVNNTSALDENVIANEHDIGTTVVPTVSLGNEADNTADGLEYCDVVRAELPVGQCARYRAQRDRLESGVRAFHAPSEMVAGQTYEVRLAIGALANREEVVATAGGSAGDPGTNVKETRVGRFMRARLIGTSFDIAPLGEAERDLGGTSEEVWVWSVKPRQQGPNQLTAELEVLAVGAEGRRERLAIYRNNATVQVNVSAAQRREERHKARMTTLSRAKELLTSTEGVLGALAAVLAAIALVVWRVKRIGKDPGQSGPGGSG